MAYSPAAPPKRSGDYTRFQIRRARVLPPSTGDIVVVIATDEWGPTGTVTPVDSFMDYLEQFGEAIDPDNPPEAYIAVYNAFKGEGNDGSGNITPGAGRVLVYRIAGSAAAKASIDLAADDTDPAITLTAVHDGTLGNELKAEVVANATAPSTKRDVRIYNGTVIVEKYEGYSASQIETLEDDINASSQWVVASDGTNGTVLDAVAATALTGGNDGTTTVSGDWTDAMEALEPFQFGYVTPGNLTDTTIQDALVAWCDNLNGAEKSKRFFLVLGGASGETYSTAKARAAAHDSENVIRFGVGTYHDDELDLDLSTAQLASRIAGVASARGGQSSLSFAYLEGLSIVSGPAEQDLNDVAEVGGVVLVALGSGGVRIERGFTTYVSDSDDKPFDTYKEIKYVTTMQSFEREGKEENENGKILGKLAVNNDTREEIISKEQQRLDQYVLRGEVQAGAKVYLSPDVVQDDDDNFIAVDWSGKFGRSLEQIRRTIVFS